MYKRAQRRSFSLFLKLECIRSEASQRNKKEVRERLNWILRWRCSTGNREFYINLVEFQPSSPFFFFRDSLFSLYEHRIPLQKTSPVLIKDVDN